MPDQRPTVEPPTPPRPPSTGLPPAGAESDEPRREPDRRREVVAEALANRKAALDRPPALAPLPPFPAAVALDAARRLDRIPAAYARLEASAGGSLGPPAVSLPEPPPARGHEPSEVPAVDRPAGAPGGPTRPGSGPMPERAASTPPGPSGLPLAVPSKGTAVAAAPAAIEAPGRVEVAPPPIPPMAMSSRPDGATRAEDPGRRSPAGPAESPPKAGTSGLGSREVAADPPRPAGSPGVAVSARLGLPIPAASARPQDRPEPAGESGVGPGPRVDPGFAFDAEPASAPGREATPTAIRAPRSDDLRNLAMASPGPSRAGGGSADPGPGGPAGIDREFGAAASAAGGGASVDLSRTNDLLQQLLDAVRRSGGPSMPPGGPSVYPGR